MDAHSSSLHLDQVLSKIRCHISSSAPTQKAPAVLLRALESTMEEQSTTLAPVAYFAALVTTLDQAAKRASQLGGPFNMDEGAILPTTLYLLAAVIPTVPLPVLRAQLTTLLPLIAPLFPSLASHTSPLCSLLVIYSTLLCSLEAPQFSTPQLRQSYASMLELTIDTRQKVRIQAQYAIKDVLVDPPTPMVRHPYLEQTADYVMGVLTALAGRNPRGKSDAGVEVGTWCCSFIKSLAEVWPESVSLIFLSTSRIPLIDFRCYPKHLPPLINALLTVAKLGPPDLTSLSFDVLIALLKAPKYTPSATHILVILETVLASPPSPSSPTLCHSWLELVENTMVAFARADAQSCSTEHLPRVWKETWQWLKVDNVSIRIATEKALGAMLRYCLTHADINEAVEASQTSDDEDEDAQNALNSTTLGGILTLLQDSLSALAFIEALPHLLFILSCLISRLRYRTSIIPSTSNARPPTAAEVLLPDFIAYVAELRSSEDFEYRERADGVLGMAIEVMGPDAVLQILPLNILPS